MEDLFIIYAAMFMLCMGYLLWLGIRAVECDSSEEAPAIPSDNQYIQKEYSPINYHEFSVDGTHFIIEAETDAEAWLKVRSIVPNDVSIRKIG